MTWRPVLFGDEAVRARALIEEIAASLGDPDDATLWAGQAGIALLHGYRAHAGDDEAVDLAVAALERALAMIPTAPWLFSGYAGVGFVLQHLDIDASEALIEIDKLVTHALTLASWDLTDGAIGIGVYALERGDAAMVARVVAKLAASVEPDGAWRSFDPGDSTGYIDLGIAHGVAGAIAFLAEAIVAPGARELLAGAVGWLGDRVRAAVPAFPSTEPRRVDGAVDGWCHGDISTAFAFVRAGQAVGEPAWIAAGHAIATRAARWTAQERAGLVIEGGLCHGEIGRAHIFHRLGLALADDELLAAARDCYLRTTNVAELGFQSGRVGVALGLLGAVTDVEPAWDRALLLR